MFAFLFLVQFLFYGLSFMVFGSDVCNEFECSIGPGAGTMIAAAPLWLIAGGMALHYQGRRSRTAHVAPETMHTTVGSVEEMEKAKIRQLRKVWVGLILVAAFVLALVNGLVIGLRG
jgi:hypothetical protein